MKHPKKIIIDGKEFELIHLFPTDVNITLREDKTNPELELLLTIFYSNHCYTEGLKENEIKPDTILKDHNGNDRKFCIRRYNMSLRLPKLILMIHTKKCLFTRKQNWLIIEDTDETGERVKYHIYFSLKKHHKHNNGLVMRIESAFIKDRGENTPRRGKGHERINFSKLARKKLANETIKIPQQK